MVLIAKQESFLMGLQGVIACAIHTESDQLEILYQMLHAFRMGKLSPIAEAEQYLLEVHRKISCRCQIHHMKADQVPSPPE